MHVKRTGCQWYTWFDSSNSIPSISDTSAGVVLQNEEFPTELSTKPAFSGVFIAGMFTFWYKNIFWFLFSCGWICLGYSSGRRWSAHDLEIHVKREDGSTVMGTSTWPVSLKAIKTRLQPWNLTLPAGHFRKFRDVQRDCPSTIHRMNGLSRRNHVRESHASDPFEQRTWRQGRNTFKPVYDTSIIYYILIYTYIHIL